MQKRHQPFHLYLDNQIYFFSVHTYKNIPILDTSGRKNKFNQDLHDITFKRRCKIIAWVILDNHYHFLMEVDNGRYIKDIFQTLHGKTSFLWNKEDNRDGRRIWRNYWDRCIRSKMDYWRHFNYIHHNPVKHGYVKRMEDYEFSSFNYYIETNGYEWIMTAFEQYPIIDYTIDKDNY